MRAEQGQEWRLKSMNELTYKVTENNLKPIFRTVFNNVAEKLKQSEAFELVIRPYKSKRSIEQNKRLWAIYREISNNVEVNGQRYSNEVWHEWFKRQFIGCEEFNLPDGTIEQRGISTTKLNTQEMTDYQNNIQAWGSIEHGIEWLL